MKQGLPVEPEPVQAGVGEDQIDSGWGGTAGSVVGALQRKHSL